MIGQEMPKAVHAWWHLDDRSEWQARLNEHGLRRVVLHAGQGGCTIRRRRARI